VIIGNRNSTNPGNLAKIGPVDFAIIGLTESLNIEKNTKKAEHKPAFAHMANKQTETAAEQIRSESVPIQLAQFWFPGLAISGAKI